MSYTAKFSDRISGTVSGSVSYPASQNGGSTSVTLNWSEPVQIVVNVEDDPFQSSVHSCRTQVDMMTASVVATEAAQIASKAQSSKKVGAAIVDGFNGLIQSEISQQMTELEALMPPKLQELKALVDRCLMLRQQMARDFARIGDRYHRLFSDLDTELERRVRNLDQATFMLRDYAATDMAVGAGSSSITRTALSSGEQNGAISSIQSHRIRQRAFGMVESARKHLAASHFLLKGLRQIQCDELVQNVVPVFVPISVIEFDDEVGQRKMNIVAASGVSKIIDARGVQIAKMLSEKVQWVPLDEISRKRLDERLNTRIIAGATSATDAVASREMEMKQTLWGRMCPNTPKGGTR